MMVVMPESGTRRRHLGRAATRRRTQQVASWTGHGTQGGGPDCTRPCVVPAGGWPSCRDLSPQLRTRLLQAAVTVAPWVACGGCVGDAPLPDPGRGFSELRQLSPYESHANSYRSEP